MTPGGQIHCKTKLLLLFIVDFAALSNKMVSFLARNFFTLKLIALVIAFTINFMLLFYKVSVVEGEDDGGDDDLGPEVADLGSADDGGEGKPFF